MPFERRKGKIQKVYVTLELKSIHECGEAGEKEGDPERKWNNDKATNVYWSEKHANMRLVKINKKSRSRFETFVSLY